MRQLYFLHSNYAQAVDLGAAARAAHLSKYHFLRLFSQIHGVTPFAYLQRKRMAAALRLIQSTEMTVDEIASIVGVTYRQTLTRQIRQWTGFTPLEIRMRLREGKRVKPLMGAPRPPPLRTPVATATAQIHCEGVVR